MAGVAIALAGLKRGFGEGEAAARLDAARSLVRIAAALLTMDAAAEGGGPA